MARAPVAAVVRYLRRLTAQPDDETDGGLVRRFAAARDEAAFAEIVRRHGPMVMGVCRRCLHDDHDAEDAFQAVFLVFMRKAASLRRPGRLANWLYGVARRVAAKARMSAARRRARQEPLGEAPAAESEVSAEGRELRHAIDEAVGRLPDKYRAPVVLCYLEGKTYAEAARALGWAEGTVSGRLSRARDLLRRRLEHTGAGLPASFVLPLSSEAIRTELTRTLTEAAVRAAGGGAAGVSPQAAALAEGVLRDMFWTKAKLLLAVVLVLGVAGAVAVGYGKAPPPDAKPAAPAAAQVTLKPTDVDDVASILHIYKSSGKVQFPAAVKKAQLVLKFYKAGRLVKNLDNAPLIDVSAGPQKDEPLHAPAAAAGTPLIDVSAVAQKADAARFALQAADLDYLHLGEPPARGEGARNACRLQVNLQLVEAGTGAALTGSGATTDVRKDVFDFSRTFGGAAFPGPAGQTAEEIPLFYVLANTDTMVGADTPADVLAKNAKADVLIVSLWTPK